MATKDAPAYAGMNKPQVHAAIAEAKDVATLGAIWSELEGVGYSREGMTYGLMLERKHALGVALTEDERIDMLVMQRLRERGKKLPPIKGRLNVKRGDIRV